MDVLTNITINDNVNYMHAADRHTHRMIDYHIRNYSEQWLML